jgi:hypothetical protein
MFGLTPVATSSRSASSVVPFSSVSVAPVARRRQLDHPAAGQDGGTVVGEGFLDQAGRVASK